MDARTFARASEEYAARLYTVAYRLLGNRADAEDAVQRALLKAFEARESYAPRWAVSTWLYRVLTNVCIDELRRRRRTPREPLLLLALHYVNGLGYRELATIRGISVNTVKSQLARGKAILKRTLEG